MTLEEFLQAIQPGVTLLAALFATLLISLKLFWYFFTYEKQLQEENLAKVKELNLTFRKRHIETKLEELITAWKAAGFKWGFESIQDLIYPTEFDQGTGHKTQKLKAPEEITEILQSFDTSHIEGEIKTEAGKFAISDVGQSFFSNLDRLYVKKHRVNSEYKTSKLFCRVVSACCLMVTILSLSGMPLQLFKGDEILIHLWIFIGILTVVVGLSSFVLMHYYRYSLNKNWEYQFLYGEEE